MPYPELSLGRPVVKTSAKCEGRKIVGGLGGTVSFPAGTGQSPVGGTGDKGPRKCDDLLLEITSRLYINYT